jgi:solute carrier family 25 (mitochondrial uncoupling protein), member 8/9
MDCYRQSYRAGGISGFWVGIIPNILRNSVMNAAEIASYDQYKQMFLQYTKFQDNIALHFTCGLMASLTAVSVGSPFDVVKTRMMSGGQYKGAIDCIVKTFRNDGILAFYKGFTANFLRNASWNITMFITLEQIKKKVFPAPVKKE